MIDRSMSLSQPAALVHCAVRALVVVVVTLGAPLLAGAQDAGLYPEPPPADSSFIRVVNARSAAAAEPVTVGSEDFGPVGTAQATDYRVFRRGSLAVATKGGTTPIEVAPAKFFSVVLTDNGGVVLVDDPMNTSRAKVVLALYNLSGLEGVELKTSDGSVKVVGQVAPMKVGSAAVNPITVSLAVFGPSGLVADLGERKLERGAVYSVLVAGPSASPEVVWQVTRIADAN
jgi:hypothetical protein